MFNTIVAEIFNSSPDADFVITGFPRLSKTWQSKLYLPIEVVQI